MLIGSRKASQLQNVLSNLAAATKHRRRHLRAIYGDFVSSGENGDMASMSPRGENGEVLHGSIGTRNKSSRKEKPCTNNTIDKLGFVIYSLVL